jgi:hypothetical protein
MLFFLSDRETAYLWAGPVGVVLGLGYARLASYLKSLPRPRGFNLSVALFFGGFFVTLLATIGATWETLEFYIFLFYLFPCSILTYGILAGRLWAVMMGVLLNMLVGLASPSGPARNYWELAGFAALFIAAAELAYSSASFKNLLDREMAEVHTESGKRRITGTVWQAIRSYMFRLAAAMLASSLAVAGALAVFNDPGLFGESYTASFEAGKISAFLLPAILVLGIMSIGLLLPRDLPARARRAAVRLRSCLGTAVSPSLLLSSRRDARTPFPRSPRSWRW